MNTHNFRYCQLFNWKKFLAKKRVKKIIFFQKTLNFFVPLKNSFESCVLNVLIVKMHHSPHSPKNLKFSVFQA